MSQSQVDKLYDLLKDGESHRTDEIMEVVYGGDHLGLARVGARIFDIKRKYGVEIHGWKDHEKPSLFWYKIQCATPTPKTPPRASQCLPALSVEEILEGQRTLFPLEPLKQECKIWD